MNKKTGPPAKVLATAEEVKAFVDPKDVAVVGFFADKESELAKAFIKAAEGKDDIEFAITTPEASGEYAVKEDKIVVFKKVVIQFFTLASHCVAYQRVVLLQAASVCKAFFLSVRPSLGFAALA